VAELRTAPRGGNGRNFAGAKLVLAHAAWVLNPLAGINKSFEELENNTGEVL
jgi:hypothetical protein